jgi:CubicO group peptidase (beta-lactamase class C family)
MLLNLRIVLVMVALIALPACHVGRFFIYNFSDLHDNRKFPARLVARGAEAPFQFIPARPGAASGLPKEVTIKDKKYDLEALMRHTGTVALLVIRHDTLLYEQYREGYAAASAVPSFSVAKSFVSALVGIAIEEKFIGSVDDPITKYLPELDAQKFGPITLRHLLNMRSGIAFSEGYYNPFGDVAKYYYGRNLPKYIKQLKIKQAPDQRFEYISVSPQLLGMAVARATGRPLAQYLQEKIWQPLGMEYDASWSLDRRQGGTEKSFCCLNARARDYAKFGRLYLRHGEWQGRQVVPRAWVETSVYSTTEQAKNNYLYSYQWWHNRRFETYADTTSHGQFRVLNSSEVHFSKGSKLPPKLAVRPTGDFFAEGILGQYVYVNPAKDLILVRLGRKENFNWAALGLSMAKKM